MGKKITTEIKFSNSIFNGKVGTLDKANPDSIYIELGTFLTPECEEDSYEDIMNYIEKQFRKILRDEISKSNLFGKDYICVFEIAGDRMKTGKKSFLSIQFHLKLKEVQRLQELLDNYLFVFLNNICDAFENVLIENQILYSRTKKAV